MLFNSSNTPSPPSSVSTPQPSGASDQKGASGSEPSGETLPDVPDLIVVPPAILAEEADEKLEIQREIERFRGSQTAGEFIVAVAALLKSPNLASVDLDAIMGRTRVSNSAFSKRLGEWRLRREPRGPLSGLQSRHGRSSD